ncbi:ATP-dependent RNA helicase [Sulfodiicoccus acidiphilus]|uniref:ATP-dependent RNA helicase n=1 Tax=Sulfodiicoccus acidiphilus TaxID=1670455 RepID=A0A348B3Q4_9CREN|nr:DEAD/DEAH box helicase [Sulfodiicoccus acidiphilus]BBD72806.1 ATP-dependent RNA helicase [Sulfodiicoccus acidiphilus]GGU04339.1 ATP-dependent RNA helicase [Sulfodiicoccus acidiphilus]
MIENLSENVKRALRDMGFKEPTAVQSVVIPMLLQGESVLVQARTGSGKTAAYGVPLVELGRPGLVVVPTRELARQTSFEIKRIGKYARTKVGTVFGGVGYGGQAEECEAEVVVGTPGRLLDLWGKGWLDLQRFSFVVIDEADTMLDMGFIEDVEEILVNTARDVVGFFSATIPRPVESVARKYAEAKVVRLTAGTDYEVADVGQRFVRVRDRWTSKVTALVSDVEPNTVVFVNTKARAEELFYELRRRGLSVTKLHGDLPQTVRNRNMDLFRSGRYDVLVATDLGARGINVMSLRKVINFDVPRDPLLYIHRIGRTGRLNNSGEAITYYTGEDEEAVKKIKQVINA